MSARTTCFACEKPLTKFSKKFCSTSCSASFNNSARLKKQCPICDRKIYAIATFCSNACQAISAHIKTKQRVEAGLVTNRATLFKYLVRETGRRCVSCKNDTWLGEPIPLEVDHINGTASDNFPSNLRLLCPTCHAMTPTAKGKNKGKGRKSLGINLN